MWWKALPNNKVLVKASQTFSWDAVLIQLVLRVMQADCESVIINKQLHIWRCGSQKKSDSKALLKIVLVVWFQQQIWATLPTLSHISLLKISRTGHVGINRVNNRQYFCFIKPSESLEDIKKIKNKQEKQQVQFQRKLLYECSSVIYLEVTTLKNAAN